MKRVALGFVGFLFSAVAFASDGSVDGYGLARIGAAIAIGIGAAGAATAQGKAASSALEGIARNPTSKNEVFQPLIISLAFMEFQALMSFVVAILLVFK